MSQKSEYGMFSFLVESVFEDQVRDIDMIIKSLSDKEREWIGNGYWVRHKERIVYRQIEKKDQYKPVGFIDVYKLPKTGNMGNIVLAVTEEYRGKGIAGKLVAGAKRYLKTSKEISSLGWHVDNDNNQSISLAKSLGFKFVEDDGKVSLYVYSR